MNQKVIPFLETYGINFTKSFILPGTENSTSWHILRCTSPSATSFTRATRCFMRTTPSCAIPRPTSRWRTRITLKRRESFTANQRLGRPEEEVAPPSRGLGEHPPGYSSCDTVITLCFKKSDGAHTLAKTQQSYQEDSRRILRIWENCLGCWPNQFWLNR